MGKEDIRKKFMNILFEPEEDEEDVIEEGILSKVEFKSNKKEKKEKEKENKQHFSAKDILYKNQEEKDSKKATVFINLNEEKKSEPAKPQEDEIAKFVNKNDDYEFLNTISPIFGVIGDNKTVVKKEEPKQETTTIRGSSPLGTIYSPIFGVEDQVNLNEKNEEKVLETLESPFEDTREDTHYINRYDDETYVVDKEISLFDDPINEVK